MQSITDSATYLKRILKSFYRPFLAEVVIASESILVDFDLILHGTIYYNQYSQDFQIALSLNQVYKNFSLIN
ncbi:MAG: hypothetical protein U5K54_05115 [Cytophagales bacterium]|nr:hypothetical protein [Cytophagales bacterium]